MRLLWILPLFLLVTSCTKTDEKIITGNKPPPDSTQPAALRSNFIIKSYIGLLGREPDDAEFTAGLNSLTDANFSVASRRTLLTSIVGNDEFYTREFEIARNNLLNGLDTLQITDFINTYTYLLTLPSYEEYWPIIQEQLNRIITLKASVNDLISGTANISEMHRRCLDNQFYDDINMGSLNFVISCYQNLLLRNPTSFESEQGVLMIDGFNAILFLQAGSSKTDFLNIFINSNDYYEGQVRLLFNRFYFRAPSSEEMSYYTESFRADGDYKNLIIELLGQDEYAGLTN